MNLEIKNVSLLTITDVPKLDPIRVIIDDYKPGAGRIIIQCFDRAWVGYWGAMGGKTIGEFFTSCDACYLLGNLIGGNKQTKADEKYLTRIIEAVQAGIRKQAEVVTL